MNDWRAFILGLFISHFLFFGAPSVDSAPLEHPGKRLVRENNCAACHQIGSFSNKKPAPKVGPSHERIGRRARPDWILSYLMKPKNLRPGLSAIMPNFRFSQWEATAITSYLTELRPAWPSPPQENRDVKADEEQPIGFGNLLKTLKRGNAKRGRELFLSFECEKCHGDPNMGSGPAQGSPQDWGPDLREISKKLSREGIASVLFSPQQIHPRTKMPSFFYDQGEAQEENAPQQIAHLTAYIQSLNGGSSEPGDTQFRQAQKRFTDATAKWGRRIAWQFNCTGCHSETGFSPRDPKRMAVPLGYRNASGLYTKKLVASWITDPATIHMHERMHGMGRMPSFGFSNEEARQIAEWLFSIDGPPGRRGSGMIMMEYGRSQGMGPGMMR